jgi:hypothetical protein
MNYSVSDIASRIRALIPVGWFGNSTPVLDALLNALATGWDGAFGLLAYLQSQTRIATATDDWLDLVAADYFDCRIARRTGESDDGFRTRIGIELLRDRCTRKAIHDYILNITGNEPDIFEPTNPSDTGCYARSASPAAGTLGYGMSGGWGSYSLPFQSFITVRRPIRAGIGMTNGWCGQLGGFGQGLSSYMAASWNGPEASDAEIQQAIASGLAAGTIAWVAILP